MNFLKTGLLLDPSIVDFSRKTGLGELGLVGKTRYVLSKRILASSSIHTVALEIFELSGKNTKTILGD